MTPWMLALLLAAPGPAFRDDFDAVKIDQTGARGWRFLTGDGTATMALRQGGKGYASIQVDATTDRRGIWWALIEREAGLDPGLLRDGRHEVAIEARIRVSHAPRRVNLQVLTDKTTDYHSHLMEFDIPDTAGWHTIRMTTRGFAAAPGDKLIGHLALMDWGLEKYRVDVDYLTVAIVDAGQAGATVGAAVPYHPPVADPRLFGHSAVVSHDCTLDLENSAVNLNDWSAVDGRQRVPLLSVDGTRVAILRWDLRAFAGRRVADHGLLELTTHAVQRKAEAVKDFGLIRVVEILPDARPWDQRTVSADSFFGGRRPSRLLNPQMIIDWPVTEGAGGKTYLTISKTVLQRLIDGKTPGIAVIPLGALSAAFLAVEHEGGKHGARLLFDLEN
jgi:hypothetical protein